MTIVELEDKPKRGLVFDSVEEMVDTLGAKEFDPKLESKTVVDTPLKEERKTPSARTFLLQVAEAAQTFTPWGYNPVKRDKELRNFWHSESWLASVVYSVSIRNASFLWQVVGSNPEKKPPRNTINAVNRILKQSNRGKGWRDLILKTCIDLYTTDNGAFWELIRAGRGATSPVVNISHLDSGSCLRTGDPKWPVIYYDRFGRETFLPYWRVRTIEELPSPIETAYGLQYSAVSRSLMAAEIIQSISTYKLEKVSGNWTKALHFVSGPTQNNIDDALMLAEEQNLNKGLYRFSLPVVVPGVDPTAALSHVQIDLASLPDNFDEDTSFKWYVAQLAAAFGVDYQEIAPLMTGNLGSSQQSEIMHLKTRGKGPALIMGIIENVINELIPNNVEFKFLEQDIRSEKEKAETQFTRSKDRAMRVKSGEITPKASREMAVLAGDMPRWLKDDVDAEEEQQQKEQEMKPAGSEFGPDQLEQGVQSNGEHQPMTMDSVKAMQKAISMAPLDFMQTWYKSSVGQPSGTIISPVWFPNKEELARVKGVLMMQWANQRVRLTPESDYHVTLLYSPLVDDAEFRAVSQSLIPYDKWFDHTATASRVDYFDTPDGKAVILKLDDSTILRSIQKYLYEQFSMLNVPISEYSLPDNWTPHITLAYIDSSLDFEPYDIDPVRFWVEYPKFTRSTYYNEYFDSPKAMDRAEPIGY